VCGLLNTVLLAIKLEVYLLLIEQIWFFCISCKHDAWKGEHVLVDYGSRGSSELEHRYCSEALAEVLPLCPKPDW
jgi:hypothetical protein